MAALHDEVYFILGEKRSQFYTSPGAWQELQGWMYAVGCLCCPPSGLNPPLVHPRQEHSLHSSALLTLVCSPNVPFFRRRPPAPGSDLSPRACLCLVFVLWPPLWSLEILSVTAAATLGRRLGLPLIAPSPVRKPAMFIFHEQVSGKWLFWSA